MAALKKHARLMYMLALLQLVGGPLVILQVAWLGRTVVQKVAERGVEEGLRAAVDSPDFAKLCGAVERAFSPALPKEESDGLPPEGKKSSGGKVSWALWQVSDGGAGTAWIQVETPLPDVEEHWKWAWPQAPPAPPPRV